MTPAVYMERPLVLTEQDGAGVRLRCGLPKERHAELVHFPIAGHERKSLYQGLRRQ